MSETRQKENTNTNDSSNELIRFSILTRIAKAVCDDDDLIRIFQIAIQKIRHYCICDSIFILYNNPQSKSFYLTPALNQDTLGKPFEISIPHRNTILGKLVETYSTLSYPNLKELSDLWPGDKHFFPDSEGSFLAVPILAKEHLYGVILLTHSQANSFDENDQTLVEDVAMLTALAMNRARLEHSATKWQDQAERLQTIYVFLLDVIDEPLAIVNIKNDLIYQTNRAFEALTGYSKDELHGMKLSLLHELSKLKQVAENGNDAAFFTVTLCGRQEQRHEIDVHLLPLNQQNEAEFLVLYKSTPAKPRVAGSHPGLPALTEKVITSLTTDKTQDGQENDFNELIQDLCETFGARYVTLHFLAELNWNLELVAARQFPKSTNPKFDHSWMISISEGPFSQAIESKEILVFEDIKTDSRFEKWRPVAEKLGYQAFITLPLLTLQAAFGILTFFYEQPHVFNDEEMPLFHSVSSLLSLRLENERLKQNARYFSQQIEVINQITNSINSSLKLEEVIQITALEISRILEFDLACITLFDDTGENIEVYSIVSEMLKSKLELKKWIRLEDSQLGWVKDTNPAAVKGPEDFDFQLAAMEKALQSKINLLLLSRGKYLGTFSISSLNPHQYQAEHQRFLSQIAAQVATAIQNARLFETTQQNLIELAALADVSKSINTSLDINNVIEQIVKATAVALKAKICTIRMVSNEKPRPDATSNIPGIKDGKLNGAYEKFVEKTIKEQRPIFIKDLKEVAPGVVHHNGTNKADSSAFLAMPILLEEKTIAIISLFWENKLAIEQRELNLISMIANQAASAIQNAYLYQKTLKNSQQLKQVNEELENFVHTVSHDLKSPIASIQSFTSFLLEKRPLQSEKEFDHALQRIQANATRMEKLIKDLLELSRIGRVVNPFEMVDPGQLIAQAQTELVYQLQKKKIDFVVAPEMPQICCDRDRIIQVFTNLISNAIKYIGNQAEPRIEIGYELKGGFHQFSVKDNGIGIDKKYHEKIFNLFVVLDNAQLTEDFGTGVGLTIVKRIIENHGGKIWVNSEPGQGSTFCFTIMTGKKQEKDFEDDERNVFSQRGDQTVKV